MKDIANIFDLPPNELEKKLKSAKSLWNDTAPQIKDFAKTLSKFIQKVETPYVLALDGAYRTGKTHFASRFSILLNKHIKTVYFSVWEQDYMVDPFVVLSEKIIWIARECAKGTSLTSNILESVAKATKIRAQFGIWGLFKIEAELSGEELINNLFPEKQRSDLFLELKLVLADFIKTLPNKKLVFVVDELDRCRPDYAVKVLETIKHFFDIPGLIFVLPINSERLNAYVEGFYNVSSGTFAGKEDYLQKFINQVITIPELNYEKICTDRVKLSEFGTNVSNDKNRYNSIQELQKWVAEYAQKAKLSYRETIEIIKRAKIFCREYKEPIRCRLLAHCLCNQKYIQNNKNLSNHDELPYGDNYAYLNKNTYNKESRKTLLLNANIFNNNTFLQFGGKATNEEVNIACKKISELKKNSYSYKEILETINNIRSELDLIDVENYLYEPFFVPYVTKEELRKKTREIKSFLNDHENNIKEFQYLTGSDDNDNERLTAYNNAIKDPTSLYK